MTVSRRVNLAFAADGRSATAIAVDEGACALELWTFDVDGSAHRTPVDAVPVDIGTQTLPCADGRVLVFPNATELHQVSYVDPTTGVVTPVGEVTALGGYLLPGGRCSHLVSYDAEASTLWQVTDELTPVAKVAGVLRGGQWLDEEHLATTLRADGTSRGVVLDLTDGSCSDLFSVSDRTSDAIALFSPASRLLVVSTNASGQRRIGLTVLGSGTPVAFPDDLLGLDAVALDPTGQRLLVHERRGAVSRLAVYTPTEERLEPLDAPVGVAQLSACWTRDGIRLPISTPRHPLTIATIRPGAEPAWALGAPEVEADAALVTLAGPAGPIEAVVYGGPDWRTAPKLALALHGGPLGHWCLSYDPLAQALVAAGYAVLQPNYRGSTGYGVEHTRPLWSGWAGADLDDVRHLVTALRQQRDGLPEPLLVGVSYGAFLALVAAAAVPDAWSGVVAIAPFLSGPRLHEAAAPWVGASIEQMGALVPVEDELGPRDALLLCPAIEAPVLLVHGIADELIPVGESRALRDRLTELGHDVTYHEVDANHDATAGLERPALRSALLSFAGSRVPKQRREEIT